MDFNDVPIALIERNRELPDREVVLLRFRELLHARLTGDDALPASDEAGSAGDAGEDHDDASDEPAPPSSED